MMGNILACIMAIAAVGAGVWIWIYERCGTTIKSENEIENNKKDATKLGEGEVSK